MDTAGNTFRTYGNPPFDVAVIHGGPGAPGQMAPVARKLASNRGILEPFQTAASVTGQIEELKNILEKEGSPPVILIGFSWGAWLGILLTARYPALVRKLILVGSGPFEAHYAGDIEKIRLGRLVEEEKNEVQRLTRALINPEAADRNEILAELGRLFTRADACDPVTMETETLEVSFHIYQEVWSEARRLRESGDLLKQARSIRCPVTAIHGEYDPHPADGVREPLSRVLDIFRFILLKNCGHVPWIEREAREPFFLALKEELAPEAGDSARPRLP